MPTPTNTKLYNEIKNKAKKKFEYYPSLYASSWINKEYRKRGLKMAEVRVNGIAKNGCRSKNI